MDTLYVGLFEPVEFRRSVIFLIALVKLCFGSHQLDFIPVIDKDDPGENHNIMIEGKKYFFNKRLIDNRGIFMQRALGAVFIVKRNMTFINEVRSQKVRAQVLFRNEQLCGETDDYALMTLMHSTEIISLFKNAIIEDDYETLLGIASEQSVSRAVEMIQGEIDSFFTHNATALPLMPITTLDAPAAMMNVFNTTYTLLNTFLVISCIRTPYCYFKNARCRSKDNYRAALCGKYLMYLVFTDEKTFNELMINCQFSAYKNAFVLYRVKCSKPEYPHSVTKYYITGVKGYNQQYVPATITYDDDFTISTSNGFTIQFGCRGKNSDLCSFSCIIYDNVMKSFTYNDNELLNIKPKRNSENNSEFIFFKFCNQRFPF